MKPGLSLLVLGLTLGLAQACAGPARRQRDYGPESALKMLADIEKRTGDAAYAVSFYPVVLEALARDGASDREQREALAEIEASKPPLARMQAALAQAQALKPRIEKWHLQGQAQEPQPAWVQDLGLALEPWNDAIAGFSAEQKRFQARYRRLGLQNEDLNALHYDPAHVAAQMSAEAQAYKAAGACAAFKEGGAEAQGYRALGQALQAAGQAKAALDALAPGVERSKAAPSFVALKPADPQFQAYKAALQALKQALREHRAQKAKVITAWDSCS